MILFDCHAAQGLSNSVTARSPLLFWATGLSLRLTFGRAP